MSYILDALKRSEGEKLAPQTLRAVEEQPVDEEYAEEATPTWQSAVRFVLVASFAAAVGIGIGWWQGAPDTPPAAVSADPATVDGMPLQADEPQADAMMEADASSVQSEPADKQPQPAEEQAVTIIGQRPQPQRLASTQSTSVAAWPPEGYSAGNAARAKSRPVATSSGERIVGMQPSLQAASDQTPPNKVVSPTAEQPVQPSEELQRRFAAVLAEMEAADVGQAALPSESVPVRQQTSPVIALSQMPQWYQDEVPSMDFDQHIYSSDPQQRWVSVSGETVYEGQEVVPGVVLQRIEPQKVVLEYREQQFTLPALGEW